MGDSVVWNTADAAAADQILHPDWVDHAHPETAGIDGARQAVQVRTARPDLISPARPHLPRPASSAPPGLICPARPTSGPGR